jgi:hypothetical protein
MRVSFSSATIAQAAAGMLAAYGYSAEQVGTDVVTDCPALLAVPAIAKRVGLGEVDQIDLTGRKLPRRSDDATFPIAPRLSSRALVTDSGETLAA